MAVGQLAHLADAVTLSTNSSASVTVPNDGSVVVGDLVLVACVMPSGSRTFAISGGAGAWNSLGTAMQSGHMSQIWWRIAEAGDLGALVTVTPSTGNIRQVLLLGKVTGALASSPVAAASNTSAAATTKTTPSLGSVGASSREIGVVWDSRGATSPNTSAWTAPAGHTRRGQAFTTAGSGSCSGAWGDSDATVSGTIGSRVWTADASALGSAWTLAIAPAEQTVSPGRIESTTTIPAPTLLPGTVTLTPSRIESAVSVYAPTLAAGAVTLSPTRIESTVALPVPALIPGAVAVSPARIPSTAVLYAPTVSLFEPDIGVTLGPPATGWAVSTPDSRWEVGAPW
ncbi:hypothetical protein ACLF6K_37435 [Streptomyces xanthophaeus]|uniref:hypothetical protein n=1 Tax=Streptomyces xanthophaeus TaxID=67385 RepID=UPI00398FE0AA